MDKKYIKLIFISLLLFFINYDLVSFSNTINLEKKESNSKIEKDLESSYINLSFFDISLKTGINVNVKNIQLGLSKMLNSNMELEGKISSPNSEILIDSISSNIKFFPFKKESHFFLKTGLGIDLNTKEIYNIKKNIDSNIKNNAPNKILDKIDYQNILFPFISIGLGYEFKVTEDVFWGTELQYLLQSEEKSINNQIYNLGRRILLNLSLIVKIK